MYDFHKSCLRKPAKEQDTHELHILNINRLKKKVAC